MHMAEFADDDKGSVAHIQVLEEEGQEANGTQEGKMHSNQAAAGESRRSQEEQADQVDQAVVVHDAGVQVDNGVVHGLVEDRVDDGLESDSAGMERVRKSGSAGDNELVVADRREAAGNGKQAV